MQSCTFCGIWSLFKNCILYMGGDAIHPSAPNTDIGIYLHCTNQSEYSRPAWHDCLPAFSDDLTRETRNARMPRWAWWATHVSCCWNNMAVWTIASWSLWSLTSASWTVMWQVSPQRYTVFPGMCTIAERFLFIRTERFPFPVVCWIPKG